MYLVQIDQRIIRLDAVGNFLTLSTAWEMVRGCGNAGIRRLNADGTHGKLIWRCGLGAGAINCQQVHYNGRWRDWMLVTTRKQLQRRFGMRTAVQLTGGLVSA